MLHAQHRADHVEAQDRLEPGQVLDVVRPEAPATTGVGHHAAQVPGVGDGCGHGRTHVVLRRHVGHDVVHAASVTGPDGIHRIGQAGFGPATDRDHGAVGGQRLGAGPSDSRAATGHQHPVAP